MFIHIEAYILFEKCMVEIKGVGFVHTTRPANICFIWR